MTALIPPDGTTDAHPGPEPARAPRPRRSFLAGAGAAVAGGMLAALGESARSVLSPGPAGSGVAGASPASGFSRAGLGRGVVTRGGTIEVHDGNDAIVDSVKIDPGGKTGWHTHPGPEFLVVTKGVLTFQRSDGVTCVTERVSAGQAFLGAAAGELHAAHNEEEGPTEFVVTFFNVPTGESPRAEGEPPLLCP